MAQNKTSENVATYLDRTTSLVSVPGAEPVYVPGGEQAVLILHGWSSSAESVRFLTQGMAESGFTVLAPTLPGHGTTSNDLSSCGPLDWFRGAREALDVLSQYHSSVHVMGASMGGALTLMLAAMASDRVERAITINAPVFLRSEDFASAVLSDPADAPLPPTWEGPSFMGPEVPEIAYADLSKKSGADMFAMIGIASDLLPRIEVPLLIIQSINDQVVPKACADEIYSRARTKEKRIAWLSRSYHSAPLDLDHGEIVRLAVEFALESR
jgi:carboxylesterase